MKNLNVAKLLIGMAMVAVLAAMLTSCYNSSKAAGQINKAIAAYPDTSAAILRNRFPCITKETDSSSFLASVDSLKKILDQAQADIFISDERVLAVRDSLHKALTRSGDTILNDCSEENKMLLEYASRLQVENENLKARDAQNKRQNDELRRQIAGIKPVVKTIEDSAKIFLAQRESQKWKEKYDIDHDYRVKREKKERGHFVVYIPKWIIYLLIGLGGLAIFSGFKLGTFNFLKLFLGRKSKPPA